MTDAVSEEEKLTVLISHLFDWLENTQPDLFLYKNISLRSAMERYFYFDASSNPLNLSPLLKVTKQWRTHSEHDEFNLIYDRYFKQANQEKFIPSLIRKGKLWMKVSNDFMFALKAKMNKPIRKNHDESSKYKLGFFVISERFIDFFSAIDNCFKNEIKLYFSNSQLSTHRENFSNNNRFFLSPVAFDISLKDLALSVKHDLFPIYFRVCFFYRQISAMLAHWNPDVLLFAEGTSHYDELACISAKKLGIKTVRIQSGRAGLLHSGYRQMNFDHMFCWGKGFVERYKSVSPAPIYHITGSSEMDHTATKVTRNGKSNPFVVGIVTQPVSTKISNEDYKLLVDLVTELILKEIDLKIVIRLHPIDKSTLLLELAEKYPEKVFLMNGPEYSLTQLFSATDCIVSFFSTVISESIAAGVIPVLLQFRPEQSVFPFPEKFGAAVTVNTIEQCRHSLNNLRDNPSAYKNVRKNMNNFSREFFYQADGKALSRQCLLIQQLIERDRLTD
jgi:hypothetical protein